MTTVDTPSTRVRWTNEERAKIAKEAARLKFEISCRGDLDCLQAAVNSQLPNERQRKIVSRASVLSLIVDMETEVKLLVQNHQLKLVAEATAIAKMQEDQATPSEALMTALGRFLKQFESETPGTASGTLTGLVQKMKAMQAQTAALEAKMDLILRTFDIALPLPPENETTPAKTEVAQVRETPVQAQKEPPKRKQERLKVTVIGLKGIQIRNLQSSLKHDPVNLRFVDADKAVNCAIPNSGIVIIWTKFASHSCSNRFKTSGLKVIEIGASVSIGYIKERIVEHLPKTQQQ